MRLEEEAVYPRSVGGRGSAVGILERERRGLRRDVTRTWEETTPKCEDSYRLVGLGEDGDQFSEMPTCFYGLPT